MRLDCALVCCTRLALAQPHGVISNTFPRLVITCSPVWHVNYCLDQLLPSCSRVSMTCSPTSRLTWNQPRQVSRAWLRVGVLHLFCVWAAAFPRRQQARMGRCHGTDEGERGAKVFYATVRQPRVLERLDCCAGTLLAGRRTASAANSPPALT